MIRIRVWIESPCSRQGFRQPGCRRSVIRSHTSGSGSSAGMNSSNAAARSGTSGPSGPSTHAKGTGSDVWPRLATGVRWSVQTISRSGSPAAYSAAQTGATTR